MNIYIKTTEACNLHCLHCYNPRKNIVADLPAAVPFLKKLADLPQDKMFIFHGGEPMMGNNEQMLELVKTFPDIPWRISTNLAYPLTDIRRILLAHMKQIRVSFDVGIRFSNIRELLRWYRNVREIAGTSELFFNICLSKALLKHSPKQLVRVLDKLGVKKYAFERITLTGMARQHADIIPRYGDIEEWLLEIYELEKNGECACRCTEIENVRLGIQGHQDQCYGKACCVQTMTINADGTIGNCPNDATVNIVGNINDDVGDIIRSVACRGHIPKTKCLACDFFRYCKGGCEQIEWQGDTCPYFKRLAKKILEEENGLK